MMNSLIRILAVATFATSLSAFALSQNPQAATDKSSASANGTTKVETAVESNVSLTFDEVLEKVDQLQGEVWQLEIRDNGNQREQQTNQENVKRNIGRQEKEWEHSLMGIYGG